MGATYSAVSSMGHSQDTDLILSSAPGQVEEIREQAEGGGLFGGFGGIEDRLKHIGISSYGGLTTDYFQNIDGGIDQGSAWAGLLDVGIEFDLERIAGVQRAKLFVNAFYFLGNDISGKTVGDFNALNNIYTDTSFNIYNLYYQQSFGQAESYFKIGQIALDDDFGVSESAILFLNSAFGPLPTQSGNTNAPIYALAAPGIMIDLAPEQKWFSRLGIYTGDSGDANASNQGFDWEFGGDSGLIYISEVGFRYGKDCESKCTVGGYYHSGEFNNLSSREKDKSLASVYLIIDHEFCSAVAGTGISGFFRAGWAGGNDIVNVARYVDGGVVIKSVCTKGDSIGLGISWTQFSDGYLSVERGRSNEIVAEITYQVPTTEWCVLQPDIQYIIHPQGGENDALLAGLRAGILF